TVAEVKSQVESIWTNAQELLGNDFIAWALAHPGAAVDDAAAGLVSGALKTAQGIADDQKREVLTRLAAIVTAAKTFYNTLQAAIAHIENFETLALAGAPPPPDGSLLQLVNNGIAVKDAVKALADYGARATLAAKDAIVAATDTVASARQMAPLAA